MFFCSSAAARSVRVIAVVILVAGWRVALCGPLTLGEAWSIAEAANPGLRSAQAALHAAEGQLAESRAFLWNNPEVSLETSRIRVPQSPSPGDRVSEWRAGLAQAFEIGGQQGRRREAAEADVEAIRANIAESRAALRAEVEQRFIQVLALQVRSDVERQTQALVAQAAAAMEKRREAGEVSRLDANLARVEAERAGNQLVQIDEQLTQTRAELAAVLQLPAGELPEVTGELRRDAAYTLDELLQAASRRRQLQSLARREDAARSRLELERASRYPDVTVGLFTGREGPADFRENVVGLSVSVPLPVFRRNEAGIGRAMTEMTQVQVERQAAQRDTGAAVRAQWQRVSQLQSRVQRLQAAVLPMLEQNQRLSQTALKEGEIGIAELLLVNRQVSETRRELLEAEAELRLGRIALERAAGWTGTESRERQ
jgi:cobalt-zinc-cadmium efflux system outer membrane protein